MQIPVVISKRQNKLLVQSMVDGEMILMRGNGESALLLFRPETLETQRVEMLREVGAWLVTGNGYDLLFDYCSQELLRFKTEK